MTSALKINLFYTPPTSKLEQDQDILPEKQSTTASKKLRKKLHFSNLSPQYIPETQVQSFEEEMDLLSQAFQLAPDDKSDRSQSPQFQLELKDDDCISNAPFEYRVVYPNQQIPPSQVNYQKLQDISQIFQQVSSTQDYSQYDYSISEEFMRAEESLILNSLSLNKKSDQFYVAPHLNQNIGQAFPANYWVPMPNTPCHHNYIILQEEILSDKRSTLMMKNIPSHYAVQDLVQEVDEQFKNKYDFIYMPYDQIVLICKYKKRKCNVGYAFINLLSAQHVKEFYNKFYWRKWKMSNNQEKHCTLRYARVQGSRNMMQHLHAEQ